MIYCECERRYALIRQLICNDRLYRVILNDTVYTSDTEAWYTGPYTVEYCCLADIIAGKCEFKPAFTYRREKAGFE
ncbi:MAG: hypothetical protein J5824_04140 [Lachnospiraceae bacterium]|nr:hypothetical protein [Lachnospiraceae bacterium]